MADVDSTLKLSLREGTIYYLTERSLTSVEPHYCIVANSDPLAQEVLLFAVCTSRVEKVRHFRRASPETLVEIRPNDLPGIITRPSIIDCNNPIHVPLKDFNQRFKRNEIKYFAEDAPLNIRDALCAAIHASVIVADPLKALVRKAATFA